jgi:flagellar hook-associated protein 3 FlgL
MSISRVTQGLMVTQALTNLQFQTRRLLSLQKQLATGYKVNAPSDNPLAARRAVNLRASIQKNEQYLSNISAANPQLAETSTSLQTVETTLQRAQELTLQGATGTTNQSQMNTLATEIDQLIETSLTEANHQTNGRYVFGGTRTLDAPFVATRDANGRVTAVSYQGNNEHTEVAVGDGVSVQVNETGTDAFVAPQNVLQTLIAIRDNLLAGDKTSLQGARLAELKQGQDQLLTSMSRVGAVQNRVETLTSNLEDQIQQLQSTLSDNIDADYSETVLNLNAQSNAYQAALNAAARVIQPSLLDFVQ